MDNFNDKGVENQLRRVERWLKRCVAACRGRSWSKALSEAECLEAEAKGLCEKLWRVAEAEAVKAEHVRASVRVCSLLKVAALAMAMVLTAVLPISTDAGRVSRKTAYAPETFEFLTSGESDIIDALRESLSSGNRGAVVLLADAPEKTVPAAAEKSGAAMAAEAVGPAAVTETSHRAAKTVDAGVPRRPSADEVISLIQVGQKALRVSEPGIKVVM
ncbi:MAG: hypothetical protein LBU13_06210 [Synergistaceae bacterium]|nr:hypothetical protein [Synergistaceae bacterium]